jgi:diadenosine tetraphosphatase ApaH/serine/threonine PP2A family protein phosphatase
MADPDKKTVRIPPSFEGLEEIGEVTQKTKLIGSQTFDDLKPTIKVIQEEQTARNYEAATQRIGQESETSIVGEFWDYYQQFSTENLPDPSSYYGGTHAELKITVLLRLFQTLYNERIYPRSTEIPVIHYFYRKKKNDQTGKKAKIFLVGDTHGSFKDTVKMIKYFKGFIDYLNPEEYDVRIVFIGDFVDRHPLDIHNILYIMTFNLKYPKNVLLLRGNHEEVTINANYGFGNNVISHFSKMLYANFNNVFMDLPLICIFHCKDGDVYCLHGGIPIIPDGSGSKFQVPALANHRYRNRQIFIDDMDQITQQLLWNDPIVNEIPSETPPFLPNRRGLGYVFGRKVFEEFCRVNNASLVFRGHQVFPEGVRKFFDKRFITVFSASDYVNKKILAQFIAMDSEEIQNYEEIIIQEDPRLV